MDNKTSADLTTDLTDTFDLKTNHNASSTFPSGTNNMPSNNNNDWQTVKRRRSKSKAKPIVGTATNTDISGIEMHKFLHACFFTTTTTPEDIKNYLSQVRTKQNYLVEQISSKRETYNSFKIGVPVSVYDDFLSGNAWPANVSVSPWQPFLHARRTQPTT